MDIFDNPILCRKCKKTMKPGLVSRNGFNLRVLRCPNDNCKEIIVHPIDRQEYEEFIKLKKKDFEVKMRMVGNSYAVSIPREIVDFMKDQENLINNMVRLSFEDAGRLRLMFNTPEMHERDHENENEHDDGQGHQQSRVIKSHEVKIVRGNKPVFHSKEFSDSAHPEKNIKKIFKAKNKDKDYEGELEKDR